jgi:hypothetical protein
MVKKVLNYNKKIFYLILIFLLYQNSIYANPPKCSDNTTIDNLKNLIFSNFDLEEFHLPVDRKNQLKRIYNDATVIYSAVPIDYQENIARYKCNATMEIDTKFKGTVQYYSQLDDNGGSFVSAELSYYDLLCIRNMILDLAVERERIHKDWRRRVRENNDKNNKEKIPDSILVKYMELHREDLRETFTTKDDLEYKSRDIDNDGVLDWVVWDAASCGSGGCSGDIYTYIKIMNIAILEKIISMI